MMSFPKVWDGNVEYLASRASFQGFETRVQGLNGAGQ